MQIRLAASGNLKIEFPGHDVEIPASIEGLTCLLEILRAQQMFPRSKIGTAAVPTQAQLDQMISDYKAGLQPQIQINLKKLGL